MGIFDNLKATRNEKVDLIRLALSNYTSPYEVSGDDAATLNNLTEFISNNLIFKKRQKYTENDLSSMLYKYSYRYFTQFVTPSSTVDLIEMMILYNKYMIFNIADNALNNIFNIEETFKYEVTLLDDAVNNINQDSTKTYSFSIPYIADEYRDDYLYEFQLESNQFSTNGKILNIDNDGGPLYIETNFELVIQDGGVINYDLTSSGSKIASVNLDLVQTSDNKSRIYNVDTYLNNIINNFDSDFNKFIDNMYISPETETVLNNDGTINVTTTKEILLTNKKARLRNTLEEIKTTGVLKNIIMGHILEYGQNDIHNYTNNVTGLNIDVSSMALDAIKHIKDEIKFTGIEEDELYIIFKNSVNTYESQDTSGSVSDFELFLEDLFRWDTTTTGTLTDFNIDVSRYFYISELPEDIDDSNSFETYKNSLDETIKNHLYVYLYKFFILMDIKTLGSTLSAEKDKAINTYEINQISESRPINYINVVHRIDNTISSRLQNIVEILKIKNNGVSLNIAGDRLLSLTFQYKELNKDIYDLFMQDQVETYVANWLTKNGSITSLFNDIYINNFNESVWELSTANNIALYTLNKISDPNNFKKAKSLTGNTINFREKEYMDIVGYHFNTYDDVYYGINSEHKQEISLFIRCFQDVRNYYFKNILLKSLINDDLYPLYEFILLVTMALDRYYNEKISKHKDLDSYTTEDINKFLDSFGLSELNEYDNFYGSFDYKMSVIRNYNNLIKNKGTRRVRSLIEEMLNDTNNEYEIAIKEYYITKSTKKSINYVTSWYYNENIYTWNDSVPGSEVWDSETINIVDGDIPDQYYDTDTLYTYIDGAWVGDASIGTISIGSPVEGDMWFEIGNTTLHTYTDGQWVDEVIPTIKPEVYSYIDVDGETHNSTGYTWYDTDTSTKYVYVLTPSNTVYITTEIINQTNGVPSNDPETIGLIEYDDTQDETMFISVPEGTDRPITTIKNRVDSNTFVEYNEFIKDDGYWNKDITQEFINGSENLNLNLSKTKYLSISASINMEVAKIMNMYIMSILDNLIEKIGNDITVESYSDNYINLTDIKYTDLIKYIKFVVSHLGEVMSPSEGNADIEVATLPETGTVETLYITQDTGNMYFWDGTEYVQMNFYGVPKITDMSTKLSNFENELKNIISNIDASDIEEFLFDKVDDNNIDGDGDSTEGNILSMNRYAYETDINNVKAVPGSTAYLTSRLDGTLQAGKVENTFSDKLRKLLLGFGYSSVDFQNSATFILDLLESTNLISIMEIGGSGYIATKAKYLKLLAMENTSSTTININNLYSVNLRSLLQMLNDHTRNKIFREDYTLKDSSVTNTLAINSTFVKILDLVIETFFERPDSVYKDDYMETILAAGSGAEYDALPEFMKDFIDLLRQGTITDLEKETNLPKYNSILNSMNTILSYMTNSDEYALLNTVNTISKNFSDAEYLNFLISLLSFFMSYKVTLYEESHQLDLSNPRETFVFAEDLLIWSELKLEEDWFFDEEIIVVMTIEEV